MSVFISYNHKDEEFVEKLCQKLIQHNVPVWRDKWQLQLGDSIINSVQKALEKASFVCFVLSKNSVNSKWVEREITASLVREIEEKKFSILPLVIDDCKLPLFLRDKLYADFRMDFDSGVKMILNAVANKYNLFAGKTTNHGKTTSFGTDVVVYDNQIIINFDIISQDDDFDYFILSKIKLTGNDKALEQFELYQKDGEATLFIREMIGVCGQLPEIERKKVIVGGRKSVRETLYFDNKENGLAFCVDITSKKVGIDNGKFVILDLGMLFRFYKDPTSGIL
ncbi:MAG: toll/interleukin-1 receptor domain-containing protein [Ruminiclostridium sp.]|nr:toll/interleukin-1 receptor domain-containing protein [Ruminiclostridium sp.]